MKLITSPAAAQKQIATRTGFPNSAFTPSGSTNAPECQCWFTTLITHETNNIRIGWANYIAATNFDGITNNKELIAGPSTMTVRAAISVGASVYPLYAPDGSRDLVLAPDETGELILEDQVITTGQATVRYWLRYESVPTRWGRMLNHQAPLVGKNEFGTGLTDRTTDASWNSAPNHASYLPMPPQYMVGDADDVKGFEIWGDSIGAVGTGDTGYVSDLGFIQRAANTLSAPFISNGAGGRAIWQYTDDDPDFVESRNRRRTLAPQTACDFVLIQMITNDFAWTKSSATCIANMALLAEQALARGQKPIIMTCPPRTNGSNDAKYGPDSASVWTWIEEYNTHVRDNNGYGYGYFDLGALWQDGVDSTKWNSTYFGDGIHSNQAGNVAAAAELEARFPVLTQRWRQ